MARPTQKNITTTSLMSSVEGKNLSGVRVETTNFACGALRGDNVGISTMMTFTVSIWCVDPTFVHHRLANVAHSLLRSP